MKANKLRQRITFQSYTDTVSDTGFRTESWVDLYTVYCSFEPLSVKDYLVSQSTQSKIIARCVIRKRESINSTMRVKYKNDIYQIEGDPLTDPVSGNEYMTLTLSKVN